MNTWIGRVSMCDLQRKHIAINEFQGPNKSYLVSQPPANGTSWSCGWAQKCQDLKAGWNCTLLNCLDGKWNLECMVLVWRTKAFGALMLILDGWSWRCQTKSSMINSTNGKKTCLLKVLTSRKTWTSLLVWVARRAQYRCWDQDLLSLAESRLHLWNPGVWKNLLLNHF